MPESGCPDRSVERNELPHHTDIYPQSANSRVLYREEAVFSTRYSPIHGFSGETDVLWMYVLSSAGIIPEDVFV